MILYNMRYKGPFEYDKFVLNTLQFHNEITGLITDEVKDMKNNESSLVAMQQLTDQTYHAVTGASIELYLKTLDCKE